ncbi:MAG: hypothetical protein COY80_03220 [Candidatus Pacebacteria bacterium CG_4_10_14_0_8_um_filter_42_14]|nr:MAG: hypothetical protein COY80_03220 [Candidatus Pacebacteria bacterium CG_4_10_14_0_8_um_filter_42_14]
MAKKKSKLPKSLTSVTPLSKYLAMALFILIPFIAFKFGVEFQQLRDSLETRGACEIFQGSNLDTPSMLEF